MVPVAGGGDFIGRSGAAWTGRPGEGVKGKREKPRRKEKRRDGGASSRSKRETSDFQASTYDPTTIGRKGAWLQN